MTEPEHHPFDPDVLKRVAAAVGIARSAGSTFASPRTTDLEQLLERDTYAETTRLQLAEKCATYRSQRDELHTRIDAVRGLQVTKGPDGEWLVRVDLVLQALAGGVAAHEVAKPTPNGPQTTVPPLEAAGIFFLGSTPSAIPELAETPLAPRDRVHLIKPIGHLAVGCEGTVVFGDQNSVFVDIDGFGELRCPREAVRRIDAPSEVG